AAKKFYGWPLEPDFYIPDASLTEFRKAVDKGKQLEDDWKRRFDTYAKKFSAEAKDFTQLHSGELPAGWDADLPTFTPKDNLATRKSASIVEQAILKKVRGLFGGAADLSESTYTDLEGDKEFEKGTYAGRNLKFGVREHGMCGALNGIAHNGAFIPYGSSFFCFTDYARGSIRLSCLMRRHVIWVFTHDSIGLGEDGPTHQPVEHLWALRAIPGLDVVRPADGNETAAAWQAILEHTDRPAGLCLTRQAVPVFDRSVPDGLASADLTARGGYVLAEARGGSPDVILIGTGSEVQIALAAREQLEAEGIAARVVSMPCVEWFKEQDADYRAEVLPPAVRARVSVEAGVALGWREFVGDLGECVSLEHFGASAAYQTLYEKFGLTSEHVAEAAKASLARASGSREASGPVPSAPGQDASRQSAP
ncbi:MAG: transketolase-like TK C-terminal-containing protein, partial [Streptosporangiaceae bacterium]